MLVTMVDTVDTYCSSYTVCVHQGIDTVFRNSCSSYWKRLNTVQFARCEWPCCDYWQADWVWSTMRNTRAFSCPKKEFAGRSSSCWYFPCHSQTACTVCQDNRLTALPLVMGIRYLIRAFEEHEQVVRTCLQVNCLQRLWWWLIGS